QGVRPRAAMTASMCRRRYRMRKPVLAALFAAGLLLATAAFAQSQPTPATSNSAKAPGTAAATATTPPAAAAADTGAGTAPATTTAQLPRELSPIGMYKQADAVVKGIIIALLAASVLSWAILLAKWLQIAIAK